MTERKQKTIAVKECCLLCDHGIMIPEGIECDISDGDGYEQHEYTHWCNKFEVDKFLQEDI